MSSCGDDEVKAIHNHVMKYGTAKAISGSRTSIGRINPRGLRQQFKQSSDGSIFPKSADASVIVEI